MTQEIIIWTGLDLGFGSRSVYDSGELNLRLAMVCWDINLLILQHVIEPSQ